MHYLRIIIFTQYVLHTTSLCVHVCVFAGKVNGGEDYLPFHSR